MKKFLLVALPAIAMSLHAAEQPKQFKPGHVEISIYDLPEGSTKDLATAVREYSKHLDANVAQSAQAKRSERNVQAAHDLAVFPKEYVYDVENASLYRSIDEKLIVNDYTSLMIKPVDLASTRSCELLGTTVNGVYNRKTKEHSGFSRVFECPTGYIVTRDMTFYGMRKITIKEQNNVVVNGVGGKMYGYIDKNGNSYTTLSWVSNNIDHLVQKTGTDAATRKWLIQYAQELVSKEAK